MSAPSLNITPASEASLAQRIVLNDPTAWSSLPEAYTDEEWRKEAQSCLDCEDDTPLHDMIAEGREADARRDACWRYERRTGRSAYEDMLPDMSARHPLMVTKGMSHVG